MRIPRDHAFVRHADPNFGLAFGGGCAEQVESATHGRVTCGFPESVHPAQPEDPYGEAFDLFENVRPGVTRPNLPATEPITPGHPPNCSCGECGYRRSAGGDL